MIQKSEQGKTVRSGRRLYTDENPKDTVGIKFATPSDARATVAKVKRINKPYARKIQTHRWRTKSQSHGKTQVASIFKKGKEAQGNQMSENSNDLVPDKLAYQVNKRRMAWVLISLI